MSYRKNIRIFKIIDNIGLPLAEKPATFANCGIGDHLICDDEKHVYCRNWNDDDPNEFVLLNLTLDFIISNYDVFASIT
jgi:hypothetical protein